MESVVRHVDIRRSRNERRSSHTIAHVSLIALCERDLRRMLARPRLKHDRPDDTAR